MTPPTEGKHTGVPWAQHDAFPLEIVPLAHANKRVGAAVDPVADAMYAQPIAVVQYSAFIYEGRENFPHRRHNREIALADAAFIVQAVNSHHALVAVSTKVRDWLERLAKNAEQSAKDTRFVTLAEANAADAKNYRAILKEIEAALAKAHP